MTLTMKEIKKMRVMDRMEQGLMTRAKAAEQLHVSERQIYRIQKSYRERGEQGLVHGNRGRVSHRRINERVRQELQRLLEETYSDYNSLHFLEILRDNYGIGLSYSTLQSLRRELGYPTPKRKKRQPHRQRRNPRPVYGMMLQADASLHAWLEDRGPNLALIAMIDDATNRIWATFREYEDAAGYLEVLQFVCLNEGIPMELYTDRRNVFQDQRELNVEEQLAGKERSSLFKEILDTLGIQLIQANSPQAKGRVERLFGTLQDRLTKALREADASTISDANQVLQSYLSVHNNAFSKNAAQEGSAFVSWPTNIAPYDLFCFKYRRTVRNDNTIAFGKAILQIPPGKFRQNYVKANVELRQHLDCAITVHYQGQQIARFDQAEGYPLRINTFVPVPDQSFCLGFVPESTPLHGVQL